MSKSVTYRDTDLALNAYIAAYRDVRQCERACRACPRYGKWWICPPFAYDIEATLHKYTRIFLLGAQIHLPAGTTVEDSLAISRPEIDAINRRLLAIEGAADGFALTFVGGCTYCGNSPCSRIDGKPCRHPDKARPSLEAFGFDVARTAADLLHLEMTWGSDGMAPPSLTLVFAVLHNSADGLKWDNGQP